MNTTTTVIKYGMKHVLHTYREHVIQSFNSAQLQDSECKGMAYSVFASQTAYENGADALNVSELHDKLWQAKMFVDAIIQHQAGRR